jgi:hypothetical protein
MDGWRADLRLNNAWSREYFLKPCDVTSTGPAGTTVICPFDVHVLHSEQLGLGPFTDNFFTVRVKDGRVMSAEEFSPSGADSQDQIFSAIGAWVRENHPGEWGFMSRPATHTPAEMQRWKLLWERYSQQYADAMTQKSSGSSGPSN